MILKKKLTEKIIINNFLKKLNFNKQGTFNFENDAAYLYFLNKNNKLCVTTDTILEGIDFFKYDNPKSIAQKITTINLSDIYAMGAKPHSYVLNLSLPTYADNEWLKVFTNHLKKIQKKYNFYLLGGDLSKSNKLTISATFFGYLNKKINVFQNKFTINDDIWISDNIGESKIGLEILKRNILIEGKLKKYFINKYLYPKPSEIGPYLAKYCSSMKDISDGFLGDLNKILSGEAGAFINVKNIPITLNTKKILSLNNNINLENIINAGDDYSLIIISKKKFRNKIKNISSRKKIKISLIGKIIRKKGIYFDSQLNMNNLKEFDHFC